MSDDELVFVLIQINPEHGITGIEVYGDRDDAVVARDEAVESFEEVGMSPDLFHIERKVVR